MKRLRAGPAERGAASSRVAGPGRRRSPRSPRRRRRPRVVILGGAGAMGRITARDLIRTSRGAVEVVVADRELGPARGLGVKKALHVDAADPASLARALDGAFLVIASLPYRMNLAVMRGALAAGAHYLDPRGLFPLSPPQLGVNPQFQRARG